MGRIGKNRLGALLCVAFVATWVVGSGFSSRAGLRGDRDQGSYAPVAPMQALLVATRLNLRVVDEWLGSGDFDSAVETAGRVKLLLGLCELQTRDESWYRRMGALRLHCDQITSAAGKKDTAACLAASRELLAALPAPDEQLPENTTAASDDFRPPAPIRNLMKLLDASYTEAKLAKSRDELSALAYTIAEGANVVHFMRSDPTWRERAGQARETAIKVAMLKPETDLKVARQELKNVYERCQECHKAFRR